MEEPSPRDENGKERRQAAEALDLRRAGISYAKIAERLGYEGAQAALEAVVSALEERLQERASDAEALELDRLDALLLTLWPDAKRGLTKAVDQVLRILDQRERELARSEGFDEGQALERLPAWVPVYLAAWGGKPPEGTRVTVKWAAELAGITADNVRMLRQRSAQFRRLEYMARHGSMEGAASMVEAGLRGATMAIFRSFMRLVEGGDPATVRKAMEWVRGKPEEMRQFNIDLSQLTTEQLERIADGEDPLRVLAGRG